MGNNYFKRCMPYKVEELNGQLLFLNRDYEVIYKEDIKDEIKVQNLLKRVSLPRADCLRSSSCYLYDAQTDPVGNEQGFDNELMNDYLKRLTILMIEMASIE